MNGIRPQLVKLRDELAQQSEKLERDSYTQIKKLSDGNLSPKLYL